jgi:hypothetical protein
MPQESEEYRIEAPHASSNDVAQLVKQGVRLDSEADQKRFENWQPVVEQAELVVVGGTAEVDAAVVATYAVPVPVQLARCAPLL